MSDVSNWRDMVSKLMNYAREEMQESQKSDLHAARMAALRRANQYLKEAVAIIDANGGAL